MVSAMSGWMNSGKASQIRSPTLLPFQYSQMSSMISFFSSSLTMSEKPPLTTPSGIHHALVSGYQRISSGAPFASPTMSSPGLMKMGISAQSFSTIFARRRVHGFPSVSR
jgi:hypothetical protein